MGFWFGFGRGFFGITVPVLLMSQPSPRETLRKLEVYKVFV